jgi:hypothetical protein
MVILGGMNSPRRFRFSLRLLLIAIAILCLWLGWGMYKVRQREAAVRYLQASGSSVSNGGLIKPWRQMPLSWRLVGASPVSHIGVNAAAYEEYDRDHIRSLFPEADIQFFD